MIVLKSLNEIAGMIFIENGSYDGREMRRTDVAFFAMLSSIIAGLNVHMRNKVRLSLSRVDLTAGRQAFPQG
jgi:hypothetical protein